ncbi:uncharacterized protein H6S33_007036 [Morchella sextelata]|uniref:uncharacterized protein n=1 Tax=Morchella sextelata TaxID=1174677 RepID=UPI001D040319|nr:uncharacterized protein H6S33_007036 [Morchella sextelata]KAH0604005.1 hypothetical protein H6S33_007036 [Morchella sextelata]
MKYVCGIDVVYGDSSNAIDGEDINKGFGGQYVYLVPRYTTHRNKAASGFSLYTSYIEDWCANDISKGDGLETFRYINTHYYLNNSNMRVVGSVYLREKEMGDGNTDDLNKDRGGRYLFLCWKYAE